MCFSYNVIEQQAYEMCEKIRENTLYKLVRVDFLEGNHPGSQKQSDYTNYCNRIERNESSLITKVILEDKDGIHYTVEPNVNGLRFAKGEINYKEYRKLQSKESLIGYSIFFGIIVFSSVLFFLLKYFI